MKNEKNEYKKESEGEKLVKSWISEIEKSEEYYKDYFRRGKNIIKYYRKEDRVAKDNDQAGSPGERQFSIFWSNIQTLQPTIYSRIPVPVVERRYKDKDQLGRISSQLLERATSFSITADSFDTVLRQVRDDYLLCGRGISWVRYKPFFEQITVTLSNDVVSTGKIQYVDADGNCYDDKEVEEEPKGQFFTEELLYEEAQVDYVNWADFLTSPCRTWEENRWVARRIFMTRDDAKSRFGKEIAKKMKFSFRDTGDKSDETDDSSKSETSLHKKARVYEIWDKTSRKVFWVSKECTEYVLDQSDDPLGLKDFFPCPKPLFATLTNDSLIPIPDFVYYQDQLAELDDVTQRRSILTTALKLVGVYDAEFSDLQDLASEGGENILVPVENFRQIAEKGGIKGMIDYVPLAEVIQTIQALDERASIIENQIYNITGMADIIRGASNPNETATAQQIKGQFATLRLADRQAEFQRFARDTIALVAEIIAEHFQPDTIKLMAGAESLFETNPQDLELVDSAIELLRNDVMRSFRVTIETDSTIAIDDQANKEARNEFLQNVTPYMQNAIQMGMQAPEMLPVFKEMLMFMIRGLKAGRSLEGTIENAFDMMIQNAQAQAEQPPQPSPEELAMQAEQQKSQMDQQIKQVELQFKQQQAQISQQLEEFKAQSKVQLDQYKTQAEIELKTKTLEFETQLSAEKIRAEQAQKLYEFSNAQLAGTQERTASANAKTSLPAINIITSKGAKKGFIKSMPDGSRYFEMDEAEQPEVK